MNIENNKCLLHYHILSCNNQMLMIGRNDHPNCKTMLQVLTKSSWKYLVFSLLVLADRLTATLPWISVSSVWNLLPSFSAMGSSLLVLLSPALVELSSSASFLHLLNDWWMCSIASLSVCDRLMFCDLLTLRDVGISPCSGLISSGWRLNCLPSNSLSLRHSGHGHQN